MGVRSENVGVVIEVEQEAPIWLVVGGIANCYYIVEDKYLIQ